MPTISSLLIPLFIFVILAGPILVIILSFFVKIKRPYQKQEFLMTETELKFYGILKMAVNNRYDIYPQVRLANLVKVTQHKFSSYFWDHFRPIGMKSIDFILCEPTTSKVLLAIELDDYTHNLAHRTQRDAFVDETLQTIKLPILHQKVQNWYDIQELNNKIHMCLNAK